MGNFLVFKGTVAAAYEPYTQMTLADVRRQVYGKFLTLQAAGLASANGTGDRRPSSSSVSAASSSSTAGNYGFEIDFACFHRVFPTLSLADAVARFRLWDSDNDGLVDILELVSTMILFATATFEEKVRALFRTFDFDDSGGLSSFEFAALVLRCAQAWRRLLGTERGKEMHEEEMEEVAKRGMMYLAQGVPHVKGAEAEIPYRRLLLWCGITGLIATTLAKHHTTDGEEARAYWQSIIASNGMAAIAGKNPTFSALESFATLRREAFRIHGAFQSWVPVYRHMIARGHGTKFPRVKVHHKFSTATESSVMKDITQMPTPAEAARRTRLSTSMSEADLKEHGIRGGAGGSGVAHDKSLIASTGLPTKSASTTSLHASTLRDRPDESRRHRPAYLAIQRIRSKVQSRRAKNDPHFAHFVYDHSTLRQAKRLFDRMDLNGDGEVEIGELTASLENNAYIGAAISAFKSLDVDQTGTLDFGEFLRAIFPLASPHHIEMMIVEVHAIDITRKDIENLQKIFEWLDEDFDGRVCFREFMSYLRDPKTDTTGKRKQYTRNYMPTRPIYEVHDDRLLHFHEAIYEMFARSHMHMIGDIKKWASQMPVFALTDRQHLDLEQLFALYDTDNSGSIDMEELVEHFTKLGFNEEDNARMFRLFDRDGQNDIDIVEFKRFYRSVYESTKAEDYGRGVTTFAGDAHTLPRGRI